MNATLTKTLFAFVPTGLLFVGALLLFRRAKNLPALLQLLGSACLLMVVFAHLCEAVHLFPWMHWGEPHSVGHYLDLSSAVLGVVLFPLGYSLQAMPRQP